VVLCTGMGDQEVQVTGRGEVVKINVNKVVLNFVEVDEGGLESGAFLGGPTKLI
ncbi:hypothetical protein DPMN_001889, partial [Dreissena polymorpha]